MLKPDNYEVVSGKRLMERVMQRTPDYCLHNIRGKGGGHLTRLRYGTRERNRSVNLLQSGEADSKDKSEVPGRTSS